MKKVTFHIFVLLVQIFLASEVESRKGSHHVAQLVKTKSGKVFLRRSSKRKSSPKREKESGDDYSHDDQVQVAGNNFFVNN